jgi:hypothetical protein
MMRRANPKVVASLFMAEEGQKNSRMLISLAELILVLKYADVHIEKLSVAGSEVVIKQPFVITGAVGQVMLHRDVGDEVQGLLAGLTEAFR